MSRIRRAVGRTGRGERRSGCAGRSGRPRRLRPHQFLDGEGGGRHAAAHEPEERAEVPRGGEAGYEQTWQARLEVIVQDWEAVGELHVFHDPREVGDLVHVGLVAGREHDMVHHEALTGRETDVYFASFFPALLDRGVWVAAD